MIPTNEIEAANCVKPLFDLTPEQLRSVPPKQFNAAWASIAFLYAGLHPDEVVNPGESIMEDANDYPPVTNIDRRFASPFHLESGWPVVLVPIAHEAWNRYLRNELTEDEFYNVDALHAGITFRSKQTAV